MHNELRQLLLCRVTKDLLGALKRPACHVELLSVTQIQCWTHQLYICCLQPLAATDADDWTKAYERLAFVLQTLHPYLRSSMLLGCWLWKLKEAVNVAKQQSTRQVMSPAQGILRGTASQSVLQSGSIRVSQSCACVWYRIIPVVVNCLVEHVQGCQHCSDTLLHCTNY